VVQVVIKRLTINNNVIQVYNYKFINVFMKDIIHQIAKSSRGIGEPKMHHHKFEATILGYASRFGLIPFRNAHLQVARPMVQLRKIGSLAKSIEQVLAQGHKILVLHCDIVQGPVVYTHA
jgi:hypothetical protein